MKLTTRFVNLLAQVFDSPEAAQLREIEAWNAKPHRQADRREALKADKRTRRVIERHLRSY